MQPGRLFRLAVFAAAPGGGNPAGVWLGQKLPDEEVMQRTAAEVGFSETAFLAPKGNDWGVRYFSPVAEVPFCGHATIAAGIVLAQTHGEGRTRLSTHSLVEIDVLTRHSGLLEGHVGGLRHGAHGILEDFTPGHP